MLFQKHCESGYRMLATTPGFEDASEIAYSHHEHYDGSGYPRGVKGADIPLGARIFAIADRLDNIMSEGPSPESIALAQEEIKELAGKEFDPEIVNEFLRMPANIWQELRNNIDSERD